MSAVLMGTAGHIDHGKTALVRALTGVDLDRLAEEKRRGITIELGFASLELETDLRVGIVDVPGHERFIKTMVAGAQGMDMAMLVVAADEGIMPQTIEHLEICRLLGVKRGLIALTKSDKVDEETILIAKEELKELVRGTFLEGSPIVACSAVTGAGIDELKKTIASLALSIPPKFEDGIFRLPIDRCFSVKGFGTVVTGTVTAGTIVKGDNVEILPGNVGGIVRGMEVHGRKVERAVAGQRLALNITGIEKQNAGKGQWVVKKGTLSTTRTADVIVEILRSAPPLQHKTELLFHVGTAHVIAEADLLGEKEISSGKTASARLHFDVPLVLLAGDRFVLRSFARQATIGGGVVLDPLPSGRVIHRGKKGKRASREFLELLGASEPEQRLYLLVTASGIGGMRTKDVPLRVPVSPPEALKMRDALIEKGKIISGGGREETLIDKKVFEEVCEQIVEYLKEYHERNQMEAGLSKSAVKGKFLRRANDGVFTFLLSSLIERGIIESEGDIIKVAGRKAIVPDKEKADLEIIEKAILEGGRTPPTTAQLAEMLGRDKKEILRLLKFLVEQGKMKRVSEELFFGQKTVEEIKSLTVAYLREHGEITPVEFKSITGTSRKFSVPLLEYFDREGITIRKGDKRILKKI